MASKAEFNAIFEISNINYPVIHAILSGFWGHGNLQMASMASKVEFGLIFEISDFNYPYTHMDVAYIGILDGLWGCGDLQLTSEVISELKFESTGLNNLCYYAFLTCKCHYFKIVIQPFVTHWPACSYLAAGKNYVHLPSVGEQTAN